MIRNIIKKHLGLMYVLYLIIPDSQIAIPKWDNQSINRNIYNTWLWKINECIQMEYSRDWGEAVTISQLSLSYSIFSMSSNMSHI